MLALDPLLQGDVDLAVVLIVLLKTVIAFTLLLVAVILMVWFERKVIGDMQNRIGPNKAGPWGLLQTLADGLKLILKEDLVPDEADRRVFKLAPFLSVVPAFVTFAVVPLGGAFDGDDRGVVSLFGHDTYLQLADPPIGVLLVLAMSSIAVYGILLAGWSSGSKYPLLGAVRGSAQMVSYEAALALSVVTVVMLTGSLSTHEIVSQQAGDGYDVLGVIPVPSWNVLATGVIPFIVFYIAATAELNRPPFDLVEAEQELVAGFQTEYSSFRFALFYLAEFMNSIVMSAVIVTLFLGGPAGPVIVGPGWLWGIVWFFAKLMVFLFTLVWVRATLPRFRYDHLMNIGWKVLIPLSLGWLLLLGAINIGRDEDWNLVLVGAIGAAILVVAYMALTAAVSAAQRRRADEELYA
ncbi:MAG TPA: NADH-quinone oxidoreductase subunit NuoH [Acidimicrobiales bacterium]|jgi:NADH-quinone oxidoreductase subunit H|nr:NADH-quinone oxidoreductase subunit NuoH [Acidimicrobiales bacterium]